jgi:hypothetical protein
MSSTIEWAVLFDQVERRPGATEADIEAVRWALTDPITPDELSVCAVYGAHNPWPVGTPEHAAYVPWDATDWQLPTLALPADYLDLLRWSNGGEFRVGERTIQLLEADEVRHTLLFVCFPRYAPGVMPFARDGEAGWYGLFPAGPTETKVVYVQASTLSKPMPIAESISGLCRDPRNARRMYWNWYQ